MEVLYHLRVVDVTAGFVNKQLQAGAGEARICIHASTQSAHEALLGDTW